jgi:prolipoprotein diacylglyceryltransferase
MIQPVFSIFSLLLGMGAALGLLVCAIRVPPKEALRVTDQGLLALLGALVGARAVYVIIHWGYFQSNAEQTWQVWLGGLSGLGAAYGFIVAILLAALVMDENLGTLADRIAPLGFSLAASAWLAAWWAGSAYGPQSIHLASAGWLALPVQDESGAWAIRWPTQLIGALLTLAFWAVLERLPWLNSTQRKDTPGRMAACGLFGFGAILFVLAYMRVDPVPFWRGLRLDAWGGLGLMSLGILGAAAAFWPNPGQHKN